jgi:hydroxyacylglutathione hydrolase
VDQRPGAIVQTHGVRRLLAPNPSPLTGPGTNTYLIGHEEVAIVDPGPDDPAHIDAILAAVGRARVAAILVTHAHRDHSAAAPSLGGRMGAPVLAFGDARAGRPAGADALDLGGGEGVDEGFVPDGTLADGDAVAVDGLSVTALHTPGHFGGHLAFAVGDIVLSGDLALGWASSLISPPDGDVSAFLASCERLRGLAPAALLPGHGEVVEDPAARLDWLIAHRRSREAQILAALRDGPAPASALVRRLYAEVPARLHPAAERNVLAHLLDLTARGQVAPEGPLAPATPFTLT